jgi:uncharacterized Tic20 family protein
MTEEGTISQDERMLAALAHGSILLGIPTNGIGGIGAALLIWLTQRDRSPYVAFQALQALVYQTVITLASLVLFGCWGVFWVLLLIPSAAMGAPNYGGPPVGFWVGFGLLACPLGLLAVLTLYGLWGAVRSFSGHDFRYFLIGDWLARRSSK